MAYSENYYLDKKKKLDQRFAINKDKVLGKITGMLNEYWEEQRNIQEDYKDIEEIVKSNEPKIKEKIKEKEAEKNVSKKAR